MSEPKTSALAISMQDGKGIVLKTLDEAARFAEGVLRSGLVPQALDTPQKVLVAMQTGMEAGLTPLAALRAVYVVKGMPTWYGWAAKALILASGKCVIWEQGLNGSGEGMTAWVESVRKGLEGKHRTDFTVADARRMKLWGKPGPWTDDPYTMLMWRAIGRHAKQWYSDILLGLPLAEEAEDYASTSPKPAPLASGEPPPLTGDDPLIADVEEIASQTGPGLFGGPTQGVPD